MKAALVLLAALPMAALSACDTPAPRPAEHSQTAEHVTATGATVRLNPNPAAPSAAYFTIIGGTSDAVLLGASSPDLERAELHESRMDGNMMTMQSIARLPVPAGEQVIFRHGGKHAMLFGISDTARTRGNLTLTLDFADGPDQSVVLAFPPQAAPAPATAAPPPPAVPKLVPLPRPVIPSVDQPTQPPLPAPGAIDPDDHSHHDH